MLPLGFRFYTTGYCSIQEKLTQPGGRWRSVKIHALCGLFSHPIVGPVLVDTGYASRFYDATRYFPERLYALTTPVTHRPDQALVKQLQPPLAQYQTMIITHFHADHVAGLRDFPQTRFIYFEAAHQSMLGLSKLQATRAAFLPALLPDDFLDRADPISLSSMTPLPASLDMAPFTEGIDLFGDGLVWGIPLPGHAVGQMGLLMRENRPDRRDLFLCADACWHSRSIRENRFPHPLGRLAQANMVDYLDTLDKLHALDKRRPDLLILPFHCPEVVDRYVE